MHRTTVDTNDILVCVCLGFACVVSGGRGKKPGNLRLSRRCSGPRVPCDRKLGWSSPLVTSSGVLEQRFRSDLLQQHSGNGTNTTVLDGGKGLQLIVGDTTEIQFAAAPYYIRSGVPGPGP